jgi:hypothetical protein
LKVHLHPARATHFSVRAFPNQLLKTILRDFAKHKAARLRSVDYCMGPTGIEEENPRRFFILSPKSAGECLIKCQVLEEQRNNGRSGIGE